MNNQEKEEKIGFYIFVFSIALFLLFTLPCNFSVYCGNANEGLHFIGAQFLLNGKKLYIDVVQSRGPLLFLLYAAVLKIFNFTTYSIIAIHLIQRIIMLLICFSIYLLTKMLTNNTLYSGLAAMIWVLLQITVIGGWGTFYELESINALEAEILCEMFSLFSIYFLINAIKGRNPFLNSSLSGAFTVFSFMSKTNGGVLIIAFFAWCLFLFFFKKKYFLEFKKQINIFMISFFVVSLFFILAIHIHTGGIDKCLEGIFFSGNYNSNYLKSYNSFFSSFLRLITRDTDSISNLFLFLFSLICFLWLLIKNLIIKEKSLTDLFFPLVGLCGIGNIFAVMMSGAYASYYYQLIWGFMAIGFVLILRDILNFCVRPEYLKIAWVVSATVLILFFGIRFYLIFPGVVKYLGCQVSLNAFLQPQSFQDPVKPNHNNIWRSPQTLVYADIINNYLPNKNDTFYVLNYLHGHQVFGYPIYIYAKRLASSPIAPDQLICYRSLGYLPKKFLKEFKEKPPKIIIIPEDIDIKAWKLNLLLPVIKEIVYFVKENYKIKDTLRFSYQSQEYIYYIYEKK